MFSKTAVAITSFLAIAEAVKVTKPAKGDDWDLSKTNEITWETVSSDPKSFEIIIVNQASFPGVSETIATVQAADGKYELKDAKVAAGGNYRINLVSTQNSGILAQSNEFTFSGSDDSSSASASGSATASASASGSAATASATGSSSSASGSAATATVTTVTTGSATASASGTAASDASGSGTASGTATGSAASGTSTSAPSSASAIKSTFAIFGSVAVAAYMLF